VEVDLCMTNTPLISRPTCYFTLRDRRSASERTAPIRE
jgi:hypothetical protein